ncbi:breast carcinoma-amplified sequence 3 [Anaeramoeba ignava]|uniref:Breast carcinoma-amplified sequence 3 n=1 Tax=Anaeramoeba ignava TaxID=1746090 RepID=A0A9Q0LRV6_ANAIG|nr:breast carcinoma-amplified sequence 3 [Anaeramoeba ignava]
MDQKNLKKSSKKPQKSSFLPTIVVESIENIFIKLPESFQKTISKPNENIRILWIDFQTIYFEHLQSQFTFLILSYEDGFQIWEIVSNSQEMNCVFSFRTAFPVRFVKFIRNTEDQPLSESRFAIVPFQDQKNFTKNHLLIYPIQESNISTIKFENPIEQLQSVTGLILIGTTKKIIIIDSKTLQKKKELDYFFHSNCYSGFAIGTRILAVADVNIETQETKKKGFMSSFFSTVSNYVSKEKVSQKGYITFYDLKNFSKIVSFCAHNHHVAYLAFNHSGSLLCSASTEGKKMKIYQIKPEGKNTENFAELIYILSRGKSRAIIESISFSLDSKYISVSTNRQTSHIFAINQLGEQPSAFTHTQESHDQIQTNIPKKMEQESILKIHNKKLNINYKSKNENDENSQFPKDDSDLENPSLNPRIIDTLFGKEDNFFVVTSNGSFNEYKLISQVKKQNKYESILQLLKKNQNSIYLSREYKVNKFEDFEKNQENQELKENQENQELKENQEFLQQKIAFENIEDITNNKSNQRPLFLDPQFHFCRFSDDQIQQKSNILDYLFPNKTYYKKIKIETTQKSLFSQNEVFNINSAIQTPIKFSERKINQKKKK